LDYDRVQNQMEAEFDVGHGFFARGGYRYGFVETALQGGESTRSASLSHHTALVGIQYRRAQWMKLSFDYENNNPDNALTRTDLFDYDQFKFTWRVGSWKGFSANGSVSALRNKNPQSDIDFTSHNRNYSVALNYEPSERITLRLDYSRLDIFSDIAILLPQSLQVDRSLFDEQSDGVGASMGLGIYRGSRLDFGYRGVFNVGTFPLNYHQPFASVMVPVHQRVAFRTYWQWYGYNEKIASIQDYRGHLVTFSLAYSY
jgi:hypothetical protein